MKIHWLMRQLEKFDPSKPDPQCWEWPWAKDSEGYGVVVFEHRAELVHRIVAKIYLKMDIHKKSVMHMCDNRICYNPGHLEVGGQSKNMSDAFVRSAKKYCSNGHELTPENIYSPTAKVPRRCRICARQYRERKRKECQTKSQSSTA